MWEWPLGSYSPPPAGFALQLPGGCGGLVCADLVDLHSQYGSAVAALTCAASLPRTLELLACVRLHAAQLGLDVEEHGPAPCALLVPSGDARARQLLSSGFSEGVLGPVEEERASTWCPSLGSPIYSYFRARFGLDAAVCYNWAGFALRRLRPGSTLSLRPRRALVLPFDDWGWGP